VSTQAIQVVRGERFEFGKNWSLFLKTIDEARILQAESSLKKMLEVSDLSGRTFLDIGSGSGLFSLAARRLGAYVHSFDYDPYSVACTKELRRRYSSGDPYWTIDEASILDADYLSKIEGFDVVYSWGVLHHTGRMWDALGNACSLVAPGGKLFIAIYNNTGSSSSRWKWAKQTYNRLPDIFKPVFALAAIGPSELKSALRACLTLRPYEYLRAWTGYIENRGMTRWRDIIDWVGGLPYEVAYPEEVFDYCRARGFVLTRLKCGGVGLGCNEFVFFKAV
jgi:2-polyprenyl-6-hydroxyphenyl methylase/3-demethylubiquinone-9 3-methyltransferase